MKISNDEQKVIEYLYSTCMLGGGQRIWFIEECGLDYKYEIKRVSQIMQNLKRKGLVNNHQTIWYLTKEGKELVKLTIGK